MKVYKLTDNNMRTYNECQWEIGKWKETDGKGELCGEGWLHCYSSPLLAVLLNPIHAKFLSYSLFIAETKGRGKHDKGLKSGYKAMRLVKGIDAPVVSTNQRIAFALLCAKEVSKDPQWNKWADEWLSKKNRSIAAADDAYAAAAYVPAYAADAAAYAAYAAANAAYDACEKEREWQSDRLLELVT